jgi:hypothetical protein
MCRQPLRPCVQIMLTANVLAELGLSPQKLSDEAISMAREQIRADRADAGVKETLARMLAVRAARLSDSGDNEAARPGSRNSACRTWRYCSFRVRMGFAPACSPSAPG